MMKFKTLPKEERTPYVKTYQTEFNGVKINVAKYTPGWSAWLVTEDERDGNSHCGYKVTRREAIESVIEDYLS